MRCVSPSPFLVILSSEMRNKYPCMHIDCWVIPEKTNAADFDPFSL